MRSADPEMRNRTGSPGDLSHTSPDRVHEQRFLPPPAPGVRRARARTGDNDPVTEPDQLRLLAVHAHPDDESSKGAATMAKYVAEGVRVLGSVQGPLARC